MTQAGVGDARASWRTPGRGADQFQRLGLTGSVPGTAVEPAWDRILLLDLRSAVI